MRRRQNNVFGGSRRFIEKCIAPAHPNGLRSLQNLCSLRFLFASEGSHNRGGLPEMGRENSGEARLQPGLGTEANEGNKVRPERGADWQSAVPPVGNRPGSKRPAIAITQVIPPSFTSLPSVNNSRRSSIVIRQSQIQRLGGSHSTFRVLHSGLARADSALRTLHSAFIYGSAGASPHCGMGSPPSPPEERWRNP